VAQVKQTPDIAEAVLLQLVQESVLEADALFGPAYRKQTRKVCLRVCVCARVCLRMCVCLRARVWQITIPFLAASSR
jgi:hypothetical protein